MEEQRWQEGKLLTPKKCISTTRYSARGIRPRIRCCNPATSITARPISSGAASLGAPAPLMQHRIRCAHHGGQHKPASQRAATSYENATGEQIVLDSLTRQIGISLDKEQLVRLVPADTLQAWLQESRRCGCDCGLRATRPAVKKMLAASSDE